MVFNFKTCFFNKVENNSSVVVTDFLLCPGETGHELKFNFIFYPNNGIACLTIVLSEFLHKMFQIKL